MNDWAILRKIYEYDKSSGLEYIIAISCPADIDVFKKALDLILEARDYPLLEAIVFSTTMSEESKARRHVQYILKSCAEKNDINCMKFLENRICRIRDQEGRNILHLAAIEDSVQLFDFSKDCISLMGQKDFQGKYPLEYVKSEALAIKMSQKWIELAGNYYLPIETAKLRSDLCLQFSLDCEGVVDPLELPRGTLLKDLYKVGIKKVEDFYCPYLKMKVNLRALRGQDDSGILLEWITLVLNEIFASNDSEDTQNFLAPLFRKNETLQGFVPTGKYDDEVYRFVGKFVAIANYFSLGLNNFVARGFDVNNLRYYKAYISGKSDLNLIRLENFHFEKEDLYFLKGKGILAPIKIINESYLRPNYIDEESIVKAIEMLTDENKEKLAKLFDDPSGPPSSPRKKYIYIRLVYHNSVDRGFQIYKGSRTIEIDGRIEPEIHKVTLEKMLLRQ